MIIRTDSLRPDFCIAFQRSRQNTGSETKAKENGGQKWITPKRKGKIRFEIVIEFGGWEEVVFFSLSKLLHSFPVLFLIFMLDMLVWVKSLLTF